MTFSWKPVLTDFWLPGLTVYKDARVGAVYGLKERVCILAETYQA